jgi:hypothetical protein
MNFKDDTSISRNEFFLEIEATSKEYNNSYTLKVDIKYEAPTDKEFNLKAGVILIFVSLSWVFIFFAFQSCCDRGRNNDESEDKVKMAGPFMGRPTAVSTRLTTDVSTFNMKETEEASRAFKKYTK